MTTGMFLFAAVDTQAKFLTGSFHPFQIGWLRVIGLVLGIAFLTAIYGRRIFVTQRLGLQIFRGVLAVISALCFIFAIQFVPLADAVAASFVAPFFVTILGAVVLREKVGYRRWVAVVVGFIGALIIVRPGMDAVHPAVFLVILAAFMFASRQVIGRLISSTDKTITTVAYTALTGGLLLSLPLAFVWRWPQSNLELALFAAVAVLSGVSEVLLIKALEVADAVALAPIHYSILIWATFYGYVIFGDLPDRWTWLGTIIIVAAGLYTIQRAKSIKPTP